MFGCLGRIVLLALVLVVGLALWMFRDPLMERFRAAFGDEPEAVTSAEIAEEATRKIERLVNGSAGQTTALSEREMQALLDERMRTFLPEYVLEPTVKLNDGSVVLSARLPVDQVPQLTQELGPAAGFLPDTAAVTARAQIVPLDEHHAALAFSDASVAKIPLPKRFIPKLVAQLRTVSPPGLQDDALALPLPPGVSAIYIRGDSLVLVASGARADVR